jgi:hypothetical protein
VDSALKEWIKTTWPEDENGPTFTSFANTVVYEKTKASLWTLCEAAFKDTQTEAGLEWTFQTETLKICTPDGTPWYAEAGRPQSEIGPSIVNSE